MMSEALPLSRRRLLGRLAAGSAMLVGGTFTTACGASPLPKGKFPVSHSEDEWKKLLPPRAFYVLRQAGTERPGSSPLNNEHRKGTFTCAADGNRLFESRTKFDSGTGWPSFWAPIKDAVGGETDYLLGYPRTAIHCMRCGGHLGHVFDDGPPPTGKRYCMNGDAMKFVAA